MIIVFANISRISPLKAVNTRFTGKFLHCIILNSFRDLYEQRRGCELHSVNSLFHYKGSKENGIWARDDNEEALCFVRHLANSLNPHGTQTTELEHTVITKYISFQRELPIKMFTIRETKRVISRDLKLNKVPGFDLLTETVQKTTFYEYD